MIKEGHVVTLAVGEVINCSENLTLIRWARDIPVERHP
jgi:hypothetical protein